MNYKELIIIMAEAKFCNTPVLLDAKMLNAYKEAISNRGMDRIDEDVDKKVAKLTEVALNHRKNNTEEYVEALFKYNDILDSISSEVNKTIDNCNSKHLEELNNLKKLGVNLDNFKFDIITRYNENYNDDDTD